jgi:hypothetical protein
LTNYSAPYMSTNGSVFPVLSPGSTPTNIIGTCAPTNGGLYSNIIIDVYVLDPEGWENGKKIAGARNWIELTDGSTYTNGFAQGGSYLGAFVDNGPLDSDPAVGAFNFNVTSLGLAPGTRITVTANYSQDPVGTTRGRTHTSQFANPVTLGLPGVLFVTTTDNGSSEGLAAAISRLQDGGQIHFNIPGAGPHHLITPVGGYPVITNHNVVIDGYTQPGSSPNSNTLLAANNAVLKIVLDSQNGEGTSNAGPGFGASETGVLFLMGTNCHVRGLCFLGAGNSAGANDKAAINIGNTAHDTHVSGCWIGVDVDGTTLQLFDRGPTAFGDVVNNVPSWPIGTVIGVKAGPADVAGARAQQNVIVGGWVNIFLESMNMVIAGNKINVLPDGMHDVDQNVAPLEAVIESGRVNNNMRVGTDGNGLNDAEERNDFGGVSSAGDNNIIEIYGQNGTVGRCTNIVIAGNYFGVAVDGVTRFTNSMVIANTFTRTVSGVPGDCQFGSDFDGVSDDVEGNVIYMNNPFGALFTSPGTGSQEPIFCSLSSGGSLSLRGNKLVNNNLVPFSYADGVGSRLTSFTNYYAPYMSTNGGLIPALSPSSTVADLIGTCASTNGGAYSNIIVDVYLLDPEGWENGKKFLLGELTDNATYTNGFAQGKTYLGSFVDNGPRDRDPAVGGFNFNSASLGLSPGTQITVTANYSQDPPGTTRSRTHTSNFSNPTALRPPLTIVSINRSGATLTINWTGGSAPYTLQKRSPITGVWGNVATGITGTSTTDTISGLESYYRVLGN